MSSIPLAAPLVDWNALGQIVLVSLLVGVGCVGVFALLVRSSLDYETARQRGAATIAPLAVSTVCGVVLAAAIAIGVHAMLNK